MEPQCSGLAHTLILALRRQRQADRCEFKAGLGFTQFQDSQIYIVRQRDRERDRERETQRETERQTDRETDRQRDLAPAPTSGGSHTLVTPALRHPICSSSL